MKTILNPAKALTITRKFTFLFIASMLVLHAYAQNSHKPETKEITYKITEAINKTFGYDIYNNGRMIIHQTSIPALPGNEGFKIKTDAIKVAKLVITKIKQGEMPPTVTIDEMKKLNVIK